MRIVRPRPFFEYFKGEPDETLLYTPGTPWDWERFFYKNRKRFNRQAFVLLTLLVFGFASFSSRSALVIFLTELLFLAAMYFQALRLGNELHLKRKLPFVGHDGKALVVEYEIRNASSFQTSDLLIQDFFSGTLKPVIQVVAERSIPGYGISRERHTLVCDAGMGMHAWGPLSTVVTDPLGIFEVHVTEDENELFEILPSPIPLQDFAFPESVESNSTGTNESHIRGESSNFFGVRDYVQGDPIKTINWKLSAKHQQLIVNEHENQVPTDLTICLDMDGRNHIGRPGDSTWKYAKDLAVALFQVHASRASRFQLLSQTQRVGFGRGDGHLMAITRMISRMEPVPISAGNRRSLLDEAVESVPFGSSFIYVMPVYQNDCSSITRALQHLGERAVRTTVVLVEAKDFVGEVSADFSIRLYGSAIRADKTRDRLLSELGQIGIPVYCVRRDDPVSQSLLRPSVR